MAKNDDLDRLVDEITADAHGEDEELWAFEHALNTRIALPLDAFVLGEPVAVMGFAYAGNRRQGLTARCRREDGSEHVIAAWEITGIHPRSPAVALTAGYRRWMGLEEPAQAPAAASASWRRHKAEPADLDLTGPVELVVLAVKERVARCRLLAGDRRITLRATDADALVPGEIVVVRPRKQWRYSSHPYLSGTIESSRLDVPALGLVPLQLVDQGIWDPEDYYWGEEQGPLPDWVRPILLRGRRPSFEMEQVLPGWDPDSGTEDPIIRSVEAQDLGDHSTARRILMELCDADLRCLDAHVHLGNLVYPDVERAMRHYAVGLRIGDLTIGPDFDGILPWEMIDNRPFLRAMHAYGICLWRLGRLGEAEQVFSRILRLNPTDEKGIRTMIEEVRQGRHWRPGGQD